MTVSKEPEAQDRDSTLLVFAAGIVAYLLFGLFLWWLLNSYIDPSAIKDPSKEATAKRDLVQALGLIMAGVAGAVGIFFTWRSLQQGQTNLRLTQEDMKQTKEGTQENLRLAQEQVKLSREDHQLTRQGQITERFTRAIDQLGALDDKGNRLFEIRVGGIYGLEQIATESEAHRGPIMEILSVYVRHHASLSQEQLDALWPDPRKDKRWPDPDVQAIADVIQRSSRTVGAEGARIDLSRSDLRFTNLSNAHLERAFLSDAYLQCTGFVAAHLEGANLGMAYLTEAILTGAHLEGAELAGADLRQAVLTMAHLEGANLLAANLAGANLYESTGLTQEELDKAIGDDKTRLPEGFTHPEAWRESGVDQLKRLKTLHPPSDLREQGFRGIEDLVRRLSKFSR